MRCLAVWLFKAACTVGLLGWLLSRPDVKAGLGSLHHLAPGWLAAGFCLAGLTQIFSAWRWLVCLRTTGVPLSPGTTLRLTLISTAAGFLSIGTLGADAMRVTLAARRYPDNKTALLGSIGLDHTSAAPAFVLMILILFTSVHTGFQIGPWTGWTIILSLGGFAGIGLLLRRFRPEMHDRLLHFLLERTTRRGFAKAALLSMPVMLTHYAVFYCAARALGINIPLIGFTAAAASADVAAALPITIAGLGVREKAFETLLGLWHQVPPASAVALSLAGLGLIFLWAIAGAVCFLLEPAGKPAINAT